MRAQRAVVPQHAMAAALFIAILSTRCDGMRLDMQEVILDDASLKAPGYDCLRIITDSNHSNNGTLLVYLDAGEGTVLAAWGNFSEGQAVVDQCYATPIEWVEVQNPSKHPNNRWLGSIAISNDAGETYQPMMCSAGCDHAAETNHIVVDGSTDGGFRVSTAGCLHLAGANRIADNGASVSTACLHGEACRLTKVTVGAHAQISQKALDYFSGLLVPIFVDEIPKVTIPTLTGTSNGFQWTIRDVRITDPMIAHHSFQFAAGQGIRLDLSGIEFDLRVRYAVSGSEDICHTQQICVDLGPWVRRRRSCRSETICVPNPISLSGEATCRPTAWVDGTVHLGVSQGKPTLHLSEPSVRIEMGRIDLIGGGVDWLAELLIPIFQQDIERLLQTEIEKLVERLVNEDVGEILARVPLEVDVPVPPPFVDAVLKFYLTSIRSLSDHLSVDLNVAIADPRDPTRLVGQPVRAVIPVQAVDTSKMLSLLLAPEVIQDFVNFNQDKWNHTVQADDALQSSPLGMDFSSLVTRVLMGAAVSCCVVWTIGVRTDNRWCGILWCGMVLSALVLASTAVPVLSVVAGRSEMQMTVLLDTPAQVRFREGSVEFSLPTAVHIGIRRDNAAEPEHTLGYEAPIDIAAAIDVKSDPEQSIQVDLQNFSIREINKKENASYSEYLEDYLLNPLAEYLEQQIIWPLLQNLTSNSSLACCENDGFALRNLSSHIAAGVLTLSSDVEMDLRSNFRAAYEAAQATQRNGC